MDPLDSRTSPWMLRRTSLTTSTVATRRTDSAQLQEVLCPPSSPRHNEDYLPFCYVSHDAGIMNFARNFGVSFSSPPKTRHGVGILFLTFACSAHRVPSTVSPKHPQVPFCASRVLPLFLYSRNALLVLLHLSVIPYAFTTIGLKTTGTI